MQSLFDYSGKREELVLSDLERVVLSRKKLNEGLELAICQPEEVHVAIHIEGCKTGQTTKLDICNAERTCQILDIAIPEFNEQIDHADGAIKEYADIIINNFEDTSENN